ncbi:conserved hypothetical protein [Histoplasma mississippiense (nom. inval.)]|uniref:conserved hypothetical protein n=1 Tax=Ajellomyces capsulatus (strain NAm1 / WU24) TaxID=2059318 RepID=UPI000157C056|nr:conserved hypothetical protein [Histoplasma mississippiense (nom. inval.)]EDN06420.1 conserved hypothetical protein [Histoplasma mississippiense (nom. inval.)]
MDGFSKEVLGHAHQRPAANYGLTIQILRSLALLAWFNCCCVCIVATQLAGAPLYFINRQYYNAYMAMTKRSFGHRHNCFDGVYTDWLYLWWFSYTSQMHGHIYIILKESLKYIPLIGQGMMFYGFIFMARKWIADKPRLQHRLEKLKTAHSGPRHGSLLLDPMWLLIFPEGTNLSRNTKRISDGYGAKQGIPPLRHQILPRSTGLFFCLQQLKGTVDWVYDCTVGYEGPPKGSYPDAYFTIRSTYLQGRPPKVVNFYWRRFAVSEIPLDDQKEFDAWVHKRWIEKDDLLERFYETGRFPPCEWVSSSNGDAHKQNQDIIPGNPSYFESAVKLSWWGESLQIFATLAGLGAFFCLFSRFWRIGV